MQSDDYRGGLMKDNITRGRPDEMKVEHEIQDIIRRAERIVTRTTVEELTKSQQKRLTIQRSGGDDA